MIDFFKKLFSKNHVFETRVVNYTNSYYIAEYRQEFKWKRFYQPLTGSCFKDVLNTNHKYHPYIGSFNECVEFCKKFKSIEDVNEYHNKAFTHWDAFYEENEERKRSLRNKSWSSKEER